MPKKKQRQPSFREPMKKAFAHATKIIKLIEKAHRDAGKSKLKFDAPLDPTNPKSVAIYNFLKELDRAQSAARKVSILARSRRAV